ncbi:ATP-binding protein [Modestobacter altitudinis]|uniref:ATP-binding protein n=1 Tax=Modestobacter altitudinis TaxID=2213158 RepID=UPI00110D1687|nr:ATP-binding protein [Modestobacter altitudinis]
MPDLVTEGRCGESTLHRCLRPRTSDHWTRIDLRALTFAEPVGLTALATFAEEQLRAGHRVLVQRPEDASVARYLARMRLDETLTALGAEVDLPHVRARPLGNVLLELTRFDGHRGAGALAQMVHALIAPYDAEAANALHNGLCEAGINVVDHARRDGGFLAAQITHNGRRLSFAVSDSGIGLLRSLSRKGARTDADALRMAIRPGISEHDDPGRGVGLSDMVRELSRLGGHLHLTSGRSSLLAPDTSEETHVWPQGITGTHLQGVIPLRHAVPLG